MNKIYWIALHYLGFPTQRVVASFVTWLITKHAEAISDKIIEENAELLERLEDE